MDSGTTTIDHEDLNVLNNLFDSTNYIIEPVQTSLIDKHSIIDINIISEDHSNIIHTINNMHNDNDNDNDHEHMSDVSTNSTNSTNSSNIFNDGRMNHDSIMNDVGNLSDFENMNTIKTTLANSIQNFETQLTHTANDITNVNVNEITNANVNDITNANELNLISNKLKKYEHLDLEMPKVTFKNTNLNEIKTLNSFNKYNSNNIISNLGNISNISNSNSINSQHSTSEISYTQHIKKPNNSYVAKVLKNIRSTKSQKQSSDIDEIDHVYNKLQDYVRYMNIDRKNYIMIICKAIEIIENYKDIRSNISNIKKDIITKALNRLIKLDLVLTDFDKKLFLATISNIIDLLVNSTKNSSNDKHKTDKKVNNNNTTTRDDIILARSGQISYSLVDKLTTIVIKKHYSLDKILVNIGTLTNILMILVDKYIYLSGVEKKLIVLQSIEVFFNDRLQYIMDLQEDKKQELLSSLDSVPLLIDIIITLQKGKYKINKKTDIHKDDDYYDDTVKKSFLSKFNIFNKKIKHKKDEYEF